MNTKYDNSKTLQCKRIVQDSLQATVGSKLPSMSHSRFFLACFCYAWGFPEYEEYVPLINQLGKTKISLCSFFAYPSSCQGQLSFPIIFNILIVSNRSMRQDWMILAQVRLSAVQQIHSRYMDLVHTRYATYTSIEAVTMDGCHTGWLSTDTTHSLSLSTTM